VVTAIHDVSFEDVPGIFGRATELRLRLFVGASARRSAAVTAISEFTRGRLIERYGLRPERVFLTPVAVADRWRPLAAEERTRRLAGLAGVGDAPFVLAVGNLHPRKNLPRLIRAVAAARSGGMADLRLVLVGQRGWHATEVDAAVDAVSGHGWVTFTGFVDDDTLQALYGHARVVAYVSLYEGLGLPVLEALACGAVVVASSTTAVPEAVGDAGLLVDPARDEAVIDGLLRACLDESIRGRLMAAGPPWAATFSRARFAESTIAAYRLAIESR
jgi:glycosyltransferase involved in cell wall biosynthesis